MRTTTLIKWFKECDTFEQAKALYKTLSLIHHPDRGGNLRDMQDINAEFDAIKRNPSLLRRQTAGNRNWWDDISGGARRTAKTWDDFEQESELQPGRYTVRITSIEKRENKKYVALVFDIDGGKHSGYYKHEPWYKHCIYLSYKNAYALKKTREIVGMFNQSNRGFDGDYAFCNDKAYMFIGKTIGVKLDYQNWNDGDYLSVEEVYAI